MEKDRTRPAASILNFVARMPPPKKLSGKQPTDLTPRTFIDGSIEINLLKMLVINEDVHSRRGVVVELG